MKKRARLRPLMPMPVGTLALYATILAGGARVLQWLDFNRMARLHSGELSLTLLASLFLGLGIWVGARLFAGRGAASDTTERGNPKARVALGISEREHQVLALLAEGLSNKQAAQRLGVSPNTVKTHVARLLDKLGARRRTEAISKARQLGLVE